MRWTALILVVLVDASPSLAQIPDPKQAFTTALGGVTAALEGRFGDDASRVHERLATLEKSLAAWDDGLRTLEASIARDLATATPQAATRLHLAVALALAERGRVDEAQKRLATATTLSPRHVDAHTVLGLVHSQLTLDMAAATTAFRKAVAADPTAPLQRYLLAKALADGGAIEEAASVGLQLRNDKRNPDGPDRSPFLRISLIPEVPGSEPYFPPDRYADGFALMGQGRYEAAVAAIKTASRTDPLLSPPETAVADLRQAGAALRDGDASAAFRLLLAHNPRIAPLAEQAGFDLQLSGHTHAGQFFPWTFVIHLVHGPHAAGLSRRGRLRVYVSAGTGTWGPPVRLGTRPELTLLRLVAAPSPCPLP